jgi:hypothetical protein
MTLRPAETNAVRGLKGPKVTVGPNCSNPNCPSYADDPHHIWSRKQLGGPFEWVEIDGRTFLNLTGVCRPCHDDLTGRVGGHRAKIEYEQGEFHWALVTPQGTHRTGLLDPQPPTPETLSRALGHSPESEACPFCGQPPRRRSSSRTTIGGRRRKTWRVLVPDDAENGAEILDTLVDDIGLTIGVDPVASGRYYILLPVLYHACQSKAAFVESLQGVGG